MMRKRAFTRFFPRELFDGMKRQQLISWGSLITLLITLSTVIIWIAHEPESASDPLVALAKINAFMAITTLSLNFILAVRSNVLEELFSGLDRMYRVHKVVGRSSLFFILLHPFFLAFSKQFDPAVVISYLLPVGPLYVAIGVIAVYLFIILIALSVAFIIPYHLWHMSHKAMGLVLIASGIHAVGSGSDLASYPTLRFWVILLCTAGTVSWIYMLLIYKRTGPRYNVRVEKVQHLKEITELYLQKPEGFDYHPGQYVFIRFPRFEGIKELFPFSISNDPSQKLLRLSIRRGGDFTSSKVPLIKKGDSAILMGPYGKFGERYLEHKRDMVWVAGGIGITPFLSLAKHESLYPTGRRIHLIWVIKEPKSAFHDSELFIEARRNPNFDYIHWFSQSDGRITSNDIIRIVGGDQKIKDRLIFMCGPPPMMRSLSRGFHTGGVHYRNIIYEDFDMLD